MDGTEVVVVSPGEPNGDEGLTAGNEDIVSTATVTAAQGAVAVAAEAVALADVTAANAEIQAAAEIGRVERTVDERLAELDAWRAEVMGGLVTTSERQAAMEAALLSTQQSLTEATEMLRLLSNPPTATVQAEEGVVDVPIAPTAEENPAERRRRHSWI